MAIAAATLMPLWSELSTLMTDIPVHLEFTLLVFLSFAPVYFFFLPEYRKQIGVLFRLGLVLFAVFELLWSGSLVWRSYTFILLLRELLAAVRISVSIKM